MVKAVRPARADFGYFIGGEERSPKRRMDVTHPFDGSVVATVGNATAEEIGDAVAAAERAFPIWSETPAWRRAEILERAAEILEERAEDFATTITAELGKPIRESRSEAARSPRILRRAAEEAKRFHGEIVQMDAYPGAEKRFGYTMRVPLGPIVCVTPFNFPMSVVLHKVAPVLASGNTTVVKPASRTPLTALKIARAFADAGLPAGVLNVVTGSGGAAGPTLVGDPRVAMVAFTGSAPVGLEIQRLAGYKRVQLELGSNAAVIVNRDGDLAAAAKACVAQGFGNAGQVCIAVQRVYAHEAVFEELLALMRKGTSVLHVGDPWDDGTDVGPMVSEDAATRIESWVREAVAGGAKVGAGGTRSGAVYQPTIVEEARPGMKVVSDEVFAPVVVPMRFKEIEQAFDLVNDTPYGLQAGIFTRDIQTAFRATKRLRVGGVIVNDGPRFRVDHMPYGGTKLSGIGREGVRYAMEEMTEPRVVVFNDVL